MPCRARAPTGFRRSVPGARRTSLGFGTPQAVRLSRRSRVDGGLPEGLQGRTVEEHEANARDFRARSSHGSERYGGRLFDGIAIDTGGDSRKRDRLCFELIGNSEGFDVARPQQLLLLANAVDGADGVDHPPAREMPRTRRDRLSRGQAVTGEVGDDAPTLLEDR